MSDERLQPLRLTLLLGGVRAGKSARAVDIAQSKSLAPGDLLFVATAQAFDDEMNKRIQAHQEERGSLWITVEEPLGIAAAMHEHIRTNPAVRVVVIDCMTLWVSNLMYVSPDSPDIEAFVRDETKLLLDAMRQLSLAGPHVREFVIVSNEVGLGVVPPTPMGRQYRDALGRVNQLLAAAASNVTLMVAGIELPLKTQSPA